MFQAASRYYKEFGNLLVPKNYKTKDRLSLGSWIQTQRRVKKGILPGILTDERIKKLNSIGMIWDNLFDYSFEQSYTYAKAYYEENGDLDVLNRYVTPDGFALGQWVTNLRSS
jgi:hypothetical protein